MLDRDESYVLDVLNAAKLILFFVEGISKDDFLTDLKTISAVVRQFEIIGEATKRISEKTKEKNLEIPWRQMSGMRDILIHKYDSVDVDAVWNAVKISIPDLISKLSK